MSFLLQYVWGMNKMPVSLAAALRAMKHISRVFRSAKEKSSPNLM